jgi:cytochrome c oxidase assembly protein subunit 11
MTDQHAPLVKKLVLVVVAAAVFGYAMVPLYNVFCQVTGFNGKTAGPKAGFVTGGLAPAAQAAPSRIDRSRLVTVEFTGTVMPGLPWEMRPLTTSLETHPGEMQQVRYLVRNTSNRSITGQAVPNVTPGQAAQHFEKIECFCFNQQVLAPGEAREMPLVFIVKPDMNPDIRHITLSYAFFSADGQRQTLASSPIAPTEVR